VLFHTSDISLLRGNAGKVALKRLEQALCVRKYLPRGLDRDHGEGPGFQIPTCHSVAQAFAQTFGLTAVDGEYAFIDGMKFVTGEPVCSVTTVMHSWVEFTIEDGQMFILDLFADKLSAIFPVLLRAPHPAYWVPTDCKRLDLYRGLANVPEFRKEVEELVAMMKVIARRNNLL